MFGVGVCRGAELERSLAGVPEDRLLREIRKHTRTQSQFLRLRRTKIGLRDFRTVKVIGKGAFGEVSFELAPFFFPISCRPAACIIRIFLSLSLSLPLSRLGCLFRSAARSLLVAQSSLYPGRVWIYYLAVVGTRRLCLFSFWASHLFVVAQRPLYTLMKLTNEGSMLS